MTWKRCHMAAGYHAEKHAASSSIPTGHANVGDITSSAKSAKSVDLPLWLLLGHNYIETRSGEVGLGASEDHNGRPTGAMLLSRAVLTLVFCAVLVTLCYFFVDRPVAYFIHDRHINKSAAL